VQAAAAGLVCCARVCVCVCVCKKCICVYACVCARSCACMCEYVHARNLFGLHHRVLLPHVSHRHMSSVAHLTRTRTHTHIIQTCVHTSSARARTPLPPAAYSYKHAVHDTTHAPVCAQISCLPPLLKCPLLPGTSTEREGARSGT